MDDQRPPETQLASGERNERRFLIETRPGMAEGQYLGLALRCWGKGHWCAANGEAHHYTKREHAQAAAERWLDEGKR